MGSVLPFAATCPVPAEQRKGQKAMKLIKSVVFWQILGVAALYGLAQLVDEGFARFLGGKVLLVCLGIGLIRGFGALRLDSREKRELKTALTREETSPTQRGAWASESKKRAAEVSRLCDANNRSREGNPLFTPVYDDGDSLDDINLALMEAARVRGRLVEYCAQSGQEGEAE